MKCTSCGYHKNDNTATHCGLCGSSLGSGGEDAPPADVRFGAKKNLKAAVVDDVGPKQNQIVYAGEFAIVYAFAQLQGDIIILEPNEVFTFGRGDAADHKIDSKVVSRRHARVHWSGNDPPVPEIVDLDSKNGITVNGVPVKKKTLDDGDVLAVGPWEGTLRVLSANDNLRGQLQQVDRLGATMVTSALLSGPVRLVPLGGLLRHLEAVKESGTLSVHAGDKSGYVAMISGVSIAAALGDLKGADAIRAVAGLTEGRFAFGPRYDVPPQSIGKTIAQILGAAAEAPAPAPAPAPPAGAGTTPAPAAASGAKAGAKPPPPRKGKAPATPAAPDATPRPAPAAAKQAGGAKPAAAPQPKRPPPRKPG